MTSGRGPRSEVAPTGEGAPTGERPSTSTATSTGEHNPHSVWREVGRIAVRTIFFYLLLLAVLLLWRGTGLFIYEGF